MISRISLFWKNTLYFSCLVWELIPYTFNILNIEINKPKIYFSFRIMYLLQDNSSEVTMANSYIIWIIYKEKELYLCLRSSCILIFRFYLITKNTKKLIELTFLILNNSYKYIISKTLSFQKLFNFTLGYFIHFQFIFYIIK